LLSTFPELAQVGAESGSSKYNKAKELNTPLIDEEGLFALIAASASAAAAPRAAEAGAHAAAPTATMHAAQRVQHSDAGPSARAPAVPGTHHGVGTSRAACAAFTLRGAWCWLSHLPLPPLFFLSLDTQVCC
jgi:hypothetical protein